jgi:hypothetical protein
MKKINNIKDLEYEKLKLRVKRLELEKQMDRSWKVLKNDLSMNKVAEQKKPEAAFIFKTGNALLNGALNYGANFLTHRLGTIAGKTVENTAEQILGKLSQKINSIGSKKKDFKKVD